MAVAALDGRMVSGPAISNVIFFRAGRTSDAVLKLHALPRQEVWLESTQERLENLVGTLRIADGPENAGRGVGNLIRSDDGYHLVLNAVDAAAKIKLQSLDACDVCALMAVFDVEYQQGYQSPGGYSDAYGIRYWDDVRYPVVELSRFEIVEEKARC